MAEVDVTSTSNWAFYERHFAQARLQHYLTRTGGDHAVAGYIDPDLKDFIDARSQVPGLLKWQPCLVAAGAGPCLRHCIGGPPGERSGERVSKMTMTNSA